MSRVSKLLGQSEKLQISHDAKTISSMKENLKSADVCKCLSSPPNSLTMLDLGNFSPKTTICGLRKFSTSNKL